MKVLLNQNEVSTTYYYFSLHYYASLIVGSSNFSFFFSLVFKRFPVMVMGRAFKDFPFHVDFMLKNGTIKRVTMDVQLNETEVKMRNVLLEIPR